MPYDRNFRKYSDADASEEGVEAAKIHSKFLQMHDLLFEEQRLLKPEIVLSWAKRIGLDSGI